MTNLLRKLFALKFDKTPPPRSISKRNVNEPPGSDLIDQCQSGPCPINSDCTSHFTGVHCDCHQGYAASGPQPLESCDDLDECVLEYGASISPCVDLAT